MVETSILAQVAKLTKKLGNNLTSGPGDYFISLLQQTLQVSVCTHKLLVCVHVYSGDKQFCKTQKGTLKNGKLCIEIELVSYFLYG